MVRTKRRLGSERRKCSRFRNNALIFCKVNDSSEFMAFTQDISVNGLMMEIEKKIHKGDKLDIEICQPLSGNSSMVLCVTVLAKTAWVKRIDSGSANRNCNKYRAGLEYLEIDDCDRSCISEYAKNNLTKK